MTKPGGPPQNGARSPLAIVALFVGLTETVAGTVCALTDGHAQVLLAYFVVGFPVLLTLLFFATLWWRNWVLYSPSEFRSVKELRAYVQATVLRQVSTRTGVVDAVATAILTEEASEPPRVGQLRDGIMRTSVFVELPDGRTRIYAVRLPVIDVLAEIYFELKVQPFSYGREWVIRDVESGREIRGLGSERQRLNGEPEDRSLLDAGLSPGQHLRAEVRDAGTREPPPLSLGSDAA